MGGSLTPHSLNGDGHPLKTEDRGPHTVQQQIRADQQSLGVWCGRGSPGRPDSIYREESSSKENSRQCDQDVEFPE